MQRTIYLLFIFFLFILVSCSNPAKENPTDIVNKYITLWEEYKFDEMYTLLTPETKENYSTEDFVDRYEKIYNDLEINDLTIEVIESKDEDTKEAFLIDVSMNSIAGPIQFTNEIAVEPYVDETEELDTWLLQWNPGLIFPQLADGGKIRIERTEPERGEILDRNEMPLAINDIAYEVGVVPEQFTNKDSEIEQLASLLHLSVERITSTVDADWVEADHFVPLRTVPKADTNLINELENIDAVSLRETTGRTYPSSEAISHLIGYVGQISEEELKELEKKGYKENDQIGKRGLEKLYESKLKGEEGVEVLIETADEKGDTVHTTLAEKPVKNGEKIQLTIDINLQELLFEQYDSKLQGTAAAIHPTTGEILALVSSPSYNPIALTYGISQEDWDSLLNDPREPFVNRFTATFAPGSVLKPIIGAIGLQNKSINHEEGIEIKGLTWKKDSWEDFHVSRVSESSKPVTLADALIRSDNIYFAMKAVEMGNDDLVKGLEDFGFNESLPTEYPFNKSQISNSGNLKNEALRANTGYGQGEIEVNVLHMALLYTPLLNEGNIVKPILLTSEKQGEVWKENLISDEDINKLKDSLRKVVTDGTAKTIKDAKVDISGKTGTAELKATREAKDHENAWFIGYPTKDEDLIIAMLVEEAEDIGTSGFVAERVAEVITEYKKIK